MDILMKNILSICDQHYHPLLNLKNVIGVGLGFKYTNYVNTNTPCIHVLVDKKVHCNCICKNNIIPKKHKGILTDVIEVGNISQLKDSLPNKYRPLVGGCSISAVAKTTGSGTLGCIVEKKSLGKKEYFILSNNHILAANNINSKGTPIIQPTYEHHGNKNTDVIAKLYDYVELKFISGSSQPENFADCAIAKITDPSFVSDKIAVINKDIEDIDIAKLEERVQKVGFASGLTTGKVVTTGVTMTIDCHVGHSTKKALFKNQKIASFHSLPGDSGSIVLNHSHEAVGLLWGGSSKAGAFCEIKYVLNALGVNIINL